MYTLLELQSKTFGELRKIGDELNVLPKGDRRYRQSWIDAIVGVNPPLLQLLEVSPAVSVEQVQPIIETVETPFAVEVEPVQTLPLESKFGRIVYPRPQGAIAQAAKTSPGVEVDRAPEAIAQAAKTSPGVEVDRVQEPPIEKVSTLFQVGDLVESVHHRWGREKASLVGTVTHVFPLGKVRVNFGAGGHFDFSNPDENLIKTSMQEAQAQELIAQATKTSPGVEVDRVQEPIAQATKTSPGVEVDQVPECANCFGDGFAEDEFGRILICLCDSAASKETQRAIAPAAKTSPGVDEDRVPEAIEVQVHDSVICWECDGFGKLDDGGVFWDCSTCEGNGYLTIALLEQKSDEVLQFCYGTTDASAAFERLQKKQEAIAQAAKTPPDVEVDLLPEALAPATDISFGSKSDLNPILTSADSWNPAEFGEVLHAAEPSGQLNLLEWDVSEPPEPDDFEGDMLAFHATYDRWLLQEDLREHLQDKQDRDLRTDFHVACALNDRNEFLQTKNDALTGTVEGAGDVGVPPRCALSPEHNRDRSDRQDERLAVQKGDRLLEKKGPDSGDKRRVLSRQPAQLAPAPAQLPEKFPGVDRKSEFNVGMLVGRRSGQHIGKVLNIYQSRRGIWRAKIQPLNKQNSIYVNCDKLVEQRLFYDYEMMKPNGFFPSGSIFDKTRGEKFEVYSRKVRSPKPTNWTAGELSSLSTFKLKQIARDIEIPSIPGTVGKRSLIRAILAEQAISQEKAAAQRERETARAIVQKQFEPTTGKKKRASASPLGTQLSLFNVVA